jgi:Protein of unknown function (DUF3732).
MKCKIREILIFGKDELTDRRSVELKDGLNIITGPSQTGKSALIEIVDYCLLSTTSTIPQGIIVEFGEIFAIILEFKDKYIVIGRPSPKSQDRSKFYFNIETDKNRIINIQKSYFLQLPLIPREHLKQEFGRYFDFDVKDIAIDSDLPSSKIGNASFRNITPFLFQHQSLIANKHALFYRFEAREIQERIIMEFPIFMKWVNPKYFYLKRTLKEKEVNLKNLKKDVEEILKNKRKLQEKLEKFIEEYYLLIGENPPQFTDSNAVINIAQNLPEISQKSYVLTNTYNRISSLEQEREKLIDKKMDIQKKIELLDTASNTVQSYNLDLFNLSKRSKIPPEKETYFCPLCKQNVDSINKQIEGIKKSRSILFDDLHKLRNYAKDSSKTYERLIHERDDLKDQIITLNSQISLIKKDQSNQNNTDLSFKEQANKIRQTISLSLEMMLGDTNILFSDQELHDLTEEIEKCKRELKKYDYSKKKTIFENELANDMNIICSKLDFESGLGRPKLRFSIDEFYLSHQMPNNQHISISEMGSGANWLACHLSLFLALHKQFVKQKDGSIPSFVFFDQPSQVYFPTDDEINNGDIGDLQKVATIYDIFIEVIDEIEREFGIKLQIIVMDHASDLPLTKGKFRDFVVKKWTATDKLI